MAFRARPAFALAVALTTVVLLGALIAGVLFATTQRARTSRDLVMQVRALAAAESDIHALVQGGAWDATWVTNPVGQVIVRSVVGVGNVIDTVRVTRLTSNSFLITAESRAGSARRRIEALVSVAGDGRPSFTRRYWIDAE